MLHINIDADEREIQQMLNGESEKMSHEEATRMANLINKICIAIETEQDLTYQDVMRALNSIKKNYEKKGGDLLNSVSIQEVAKFGGLLN